MILITHAVLILGLAVLSLLVFLMVRQVGVMSQQILKDERNPAPALEPGTVAPVRTFKAYGESEASTIQPAETGGTFLLFISFSCPICRPLLADLPGLAEAAGKVVLMFLDGGVASRHPKEFQDLKQSGYRMVEANRMARKFKIKYAPYLYTLDPAGVIRDARRVYKRKDLLDVIRNYEGSEILERRIEHVSAPQQ